MRPHSCNARWTFGCVRSKKRLSKRPPPISRLSLPTGAWGKQAKEYYNKQDLAARILEERQSIYAEDALSKKEIEARELFDEGLMPLQTRHYLYLSGTPFRAIASGEFIEEQIFNWTYSDEQTAKRDWAGSRHPCGMGLRRYGRMAGGLE